jgi:hypothetical protein
MSIKIKIKNIYFWLNGRNEKKFFLTKRQKTINQNNEDQSWDKKKIKTILLLKGEIEKQINLTKTPPNDKKKYL